VKPILILGLGNPLQGDDGVGCRVAEALEHVDLPGEVEVLDGGTPGVGLVNLLQGRQRAILVDAADMDQPPGSVVRFRPEDVLLTGSAERFSLHRSGVADALALASALKLPLPEIVVFGIQPERVGWGEGLSPAVQAAVQVVIKSILKEW
jgi:hydrogenase maturation protease